MPHRSSRIVRPLLIIINGSDITISPVALTRRGLFLLLRFAAVVVLLFFRSAPAAT
jgi:hypothetical protein